MVILSDSKEQNVGLDSKFRVGIMQHKKVIEHFQICRVFLNNYMVKIYFILLLYLFHDFNRIIYSYDRRWKGWQNLPYLSQMKLCLVQYSKDESINWNWWIGFYNVIKLSLASHCKNLLSLLVGLYWTSMYISDNMHKTYIVSGINATVLCHMVFFGTVHWVQTTYCTCSHGLIMDQIHITADSWRILSNWIMVKMFVNLYYHVHNSSRLSYDRDEKICNMQ